MDRHAPILLVEPDINPVTRRFGLPAVASYPPLAQVRLAGQLDDQSVRIVDLRIARERKGFESLVRSTRPALAGISLTFTSNGDEAIRVAAAVRRASPGTIIVLGGTGASEDPGAFYDSDVDFIAFRQGDAPLASLVGELRRTGAVPSSAPGFFHRKDGAWALGGSVEAPPMDELKPYAWSALPPHAWKHYFQGYRPTGMGQMSEGCPFDCTFCSVWKVHGRSVSVASLENVKHDLRSLPPFVRSFFFADDIWMQGTEAQLRALHDPLLGWIAAELLPRRRDLWFTAETRTDLFLRHEERFRAWAREGNLMRILFGVEAVTDVQLDRFSKRTTVDVNSEAIRKAAECGVFVTAQFVIPCDADRAYFDELARFLESHRAYIDVSNFTIATPLPGTELYEDVLTKHPELADRNVVSHPAFSLFTALTPTRMEPAEFYHQVARVHRVANQFELDWTALENLGRLALRSPWLLPNVLKLPSHLKNLTRAETFLSTHREVQGERLLARHLV
jgi:magnesium-protoporphyrin IX monomethyl ester (oxidative) cyclase